MPVKLHQILPESIARILQILLQKQNILLMNSVLFVIFTGRYYCTSCHQLLVNFMLV